MPYTMKPLACEPSRIKGMSEKLLVSHYENNYGGAVNRLNAIEGQLVELDFAKAPGFLINGLKREELIASNSMILHELYFASLGERGEPEGSLRDALIRDFGSLAVLFRFKVSNPLLIAATAVIGLIAFPLLQPGWVYVK